jgi:hypothetical protein
MGGVFGFSAIVGLDDFLHEGVSDDVDGREFHEGDRVDATKNPTGITESGASATRQVDLGHVSGNHSLAGRS